MEERTHAYRTPSEDERLAAIVALGVPDPDSPANAFRTARDEVETFVRWVG